MSETEKRLREIITKYLGEYRGNRPQDLAYIMIGMLYVIGKELDTPNEEMMNAYKNVFHDQIGRGLF